MGSLDQASATAPGMKAGAEPPFFSIVVPTRDRPELFRLALESVIAQGYTDFEVLVVNDGSSEQHLPSYRSMEPEYDTRVYWHYQPRRPNGHGQSYSMNTGALLARGRYLCFLDDDDAWTDPAHLQRLRDLIDESREPPDVIYSNQTAFDSAGREIPRKMWIADLDEKVTPGMLIAAGAYRVSPELLLQSSGFAHLNCTVIRRSLYLEMGGMDENIRYECDRDLFIRTIDRANIIAYLPHHVARHNVPDPSKRDNMSTLVSDLEKRLYQVTVLEKAVLMCRRESVRASAARGLANTYKHMATSLAANGNWHEASRHARLALAMRYSLKWQLHCLYLSIRARF